MDSTKPPSPSVHAKMHPYCPDTLPNDATIVAILLCTFNGEKFLREQLDSILAQTHKNWVIHVSDDGSTDDTLNILREYQHNLGPDRLKLYEGPRQGFANNFLSLIKNKSITGNFFAFSDQDDIWNETKLEKSLSNLNTKKNSSLPALYCSRARLIDSNRQYVGMSPLRLKPPSFKNAIVQSLAGANTMLVNIPARNLLAKTPNNVEVVAHDWLAYLLITACGGSVIYDKTPSLDYRQHDHNLIGSKIGILNNILRIKGLTTGKFSRWNEQNCHILHQMEYTLTADNFKILKSYEKIRSSGLFTRLKIFHQLGIYRQNSIDNILLFLAVIFKKL
jgi:glycosyltransferase involved in cell wall biosynthesis